MHYISFGNKKETFIKIQKLLVFDGKEEVPCFLQHSHQYDFVVRNDWFAQLNCVIFEFVGWDE